MCEKALTLFDRGKLANCAWFFGCMTLGIAAITGMAWAYYRGKPIKLCAPEEASDIRAAKKCAGK